MKKIFNLSRLPRVLITLLYAMVLGCIHLAYASPSTECPTPHALSVAAGGSTFVDLSSCSVFGFNGVSVSPAHGHLTGINSSTGNGTAQFTYVNNGDGSLSDTFTVLDDSNGSIVFNVTVQAAVSISITPNSLSSATVSSIYSQSLTSSGGTAPYSYSITSGALPAGLSLSSAGTLSGTPTAGGSFNFTVTSTDSASVTGSQAYTLTVNAPTISVSPTTLPSATVSSAYSQSVTASGGTAPYTFAITSGALPAGLSLSGSGTLSGTPTAGGTFNFTVTTTDSSTGTGPYTSSRAYSLTVSAATVTLSPTTLSATTVGTSVNQSITASGGTAPYTYSITSGSLPAGLSLSSSGTLSGTPTAGGSFNFTVTTTDSSTGTGPYTGSRAYTLTVNAPTISVSPTTLPSVTVFTAYSQTITANGGTAPYTFAITSGALPTGLSLSSSGTLSGTSTASGTFNFTITTTDSSTGTGAYTGSRAYSLTVSAATVTLSPTTLSAATVGTSVSQSITASGGTAPYTYSITSGSLPAGLSLSSSGTLSGTPTAGGTFNFTVNATDSSTGAGGPYSGSRAYSITVNSPTLSLTPSTLNAGTTYSAYSQSMTASGGTAPYTFAITSGQLPSGLTLSSTGVLSGTPTVSGSFSVSISITDSSTGTGAPFSTSSNYTLVINSPTLSFTSNSISSGTVGQTYSTTISASGGSAPYTYTLFSGTLPAGLSLSSGGVISGTPTTTGNFTFTVRATDAGNFTTQQALTLTIAAAQIAAAAHSATVSAGATVAVDLMANAIGAPFTSAAIVSISPSTAGTAVIRNAGNSGTPSYQMSFTASSQFSGSVVVSYTLSNAYATSVPAAVTITVAARPNVSTDAQVTGLTTSQTNIAQRFSTTQLSNFTNRLESLHGSGWGNSGFGLSLTPPTTPSRQPMVPDTAQLEANGPDRLLGSSLTPDMRRVSWSPSGFDSSSNNEPASQSPSMPLSAETLLIASTLPELETHQNDLNLKQPLSVWINGQIDFGQQYVNSKQTGFKFTTNGISFGGDYRLSDFATFGLGAGFGHGSADIGSDGSKNTTDSLVATMYGSLRPAKNIFIDGILGYGTLNFNTTRYVTDDSSFATGTRHGNQLFGSIISGMEFRNQGWMWSPYGGIEMTSATLNQYSETATNLNALTYFKQTTRTTNGTLGVRTEGGYTSSFGTWIPRARVEFRYQFQGASEAPLAYADLAAAGPAYVIPATSQDSGIWTTGLGLRLVRHNGTTFTIDYSNNISIGNSHSQSIMFNIQIPTYWFATGVGSKL